MILTFSLLYFHKTVRCGCGSLAVGSKLAGFFNLVIATVPIICEIDFIFYTKTLICNTIFYVIYLVCICYVCK